MLDFFIQIVEKLHCIGNFLFFRSWIKAKTNDVLREEVQKILLANACLIVNFIGAR